MSNSNLPTAQLTKTGKLGTETTFDFSDLRKGILPTYVYGVVTDGVALPPSI